MSYVQFIFYLARLLWLVLLTAFVAVVLLFLGLCAAFENVEEQFARFVQGGKR